MRLFSRFFTKIEPSNIKLVEIEKRIENLENSLKENVKQLIEKTDNLKNNNEDPSRIKIEHLNVEQIIVEKLEYANNFGQLGIKELTGKLNIGTSYEGDVSKKVEEKESKHPKINLRSK